MSAQTNIGPMREWCIAASARWFAFRAEIETIKAARIREAIVYRANFNVPPIRSNSPAFDLHHPDGA